MNDVMKLLNKKQCHECGEYKLYWFPFVQGRDGIQDGRHKLNEIQVSMVLGCDYCSETIGSVSADEFLAVFNGAE